MAIPRAPALPEVVRQPSPPVDDEKSLATAVVSKKYIDELPSHESRSNACARRERRPSLPGKSRSRPTLVQVPVGGSPKARTAGSRASRARPASRGCGPGSLSRPQGKPDGKKTPPPRSTGRGGGRVGDARVRRGPAGAALGLERDAGHRSEPHRLDGMRRRAPTRILSAERRKQPGLELFGHLGRREPGRRRELESEARVPHAVARNRAGSSVSRRNVDGMCGNTAASTLRTSAAPSRLRRGHFRGDESRWRRGCDADIPWRRCRRGCGADISAETVPPRLRRGHSVETVPPRLRRGHSVTLGSRA